MNEEENKARLMALLAHGYPREMMVRPPPEMVRASFMKKFGLNPLGDELDNQLNWIDEAAALRALTQRPDEGARASLSAISKSVSNSAARDTMGKVAKSVTGASPRPVTPVPLGALKNGLY